MAALIAVNAAGPHPIAQAVEHLRTCHSFRWIPLPAAPGYRLADAAAMR